MKRLECNMCPGIKPTLYRSKRILARHLLDVHPEESSTAYGLLEQARVHMAKARKRIPAPRYRRNPWRKVKKSKAQPGKK